MWLAELTPLLFATRAELVPLVNIKQGSFIQLKVRTLLPSLASLCHVLGCADVLVQARPRAANLLLQIMI